MTKMLTAPRIPPKPESDGGSAAELIKALNNPIRRAALRALLASESWASSVQLRRAMSEHVSGNTLNNHLAILVTCGAIRRVKRAGYKESYFSATEAVRVPWILTALKLTAAED